MEVENSGHIEKTYQKKTQLEHVLLRPDTYVGSCEPITQNMWIIDPNDFKLKDKKITYVPGLYKIFDEILVNAADNFQRDNKMSQIKVDIDKSKGKITVWNNGKGIPVVMHKEHKVYVPELVFGHLLTSSHYDDKIKKVTGGRNGYGAKLANIFSKKMTIETADSKNKKLYKQNFTGNMKNIEEPVITPYDAEKFDYTEVSFEPDFKKFGIKGLDNDMLGLIYKRVYDIAGITPEKVKVYLNGKKIKEVDNFKTYIEMYMKALNEDNGTEAPFIYEKPHPRWEIGISSSDGQFQQVSYVNSI